MRAYTHTHTLTHSHVAGLYYQSFLVFLFQIGWIDLIAPTLLQPWMNAGPKILEKLVLVVQSMTMLLFPV